MAVKQHVTENSNRPNEEDIINILLLIDNFNDSDNFVTEQDLLGLLESLITELGNLTAPAESKALKMFRDDLLKIQKQLFKVIQEHAHSEDTLTICLRHVYKLITKKDNPSSAVSIILNLFDVKYIPKAIQWLLKESSTTDHDVKKGVFVLCVWLPMGIAPQWIISIINGLQEQKKQQLLLEIATENIERLSTFVVMPCLTLQVLPILIRLIVLSSHIFRQFLPSFRKLLKLLENGRNDNEMQKHMQNLLYEVNKCIINYPNNDSLYEDTKSILNNYDTSIYTDASSVTSLYFNDNIGADVFPQSHQDLVLSRNVRVGLVNLGNTCYMNSVLQALVMTKPFSQEMLLATSDNLLLKNMQKLFVLLLHSNSPDFIPGVFLNSARPPGFHPGQQQDSSEFLGHLLDALHEEEKSRNDITFFNIKRELMQSVNHNNMNPNNNNNNNDSNDIVDSSVNAFYEIETNKEHLEMDIDPPDVCSDDDEDEYDEDDGGGDCGGGVENDADEHIINKKSKLISPSKVNYNRNRNQLQIQQQQHQLYQQQRLEKLKEQHHAAKTLIQKTFSGKISITHKCLECKTESKHYDAFRELQLSFPDTDIIPTNYSVQDLLDYFCSPEKLDGDNKYFCDQCKRLCDGERFINIIEAPKNLILTLKHFKYDQKYNLRAKLMHKVYHDDNVNILVMNPATMLDYNLNYQLYAAVVHSGVSLDSGHYYTYGADHNGWYKFNDSLVTNSSISELHNLEPPNTPYILFYQMENSSSIAFASGAYSTPTSPSASSPTADQHIQTSLFSLASSLNTNSTSSSSASSTTSSSTNTNYKSNNVQNFETTHSKRPCLEILDGKLNSTNPVEDFNVESYFSDRKGTVQNVNLPMDYLPAYLREYVKAYDTSYLHELQLAASKARLHFALRNNTKNNLYNNSHNNIKNNNNNNNEDDDDPPSKCGGNAINTSNQYIL